jgi:hypothetical protein
VFAPQDADPVLGPILNAFHACLCAYFVKAGRPVCQCALVPGNSAPPADRCDCACDNGGAGQAWVRWVRDTPYLATGATQNRRQCVQFRTRKIIEAGVYRCVSGPGEDGTPPDVDARERDAWGLIYDRNILRSAVACCPVFRGKQLDLVSLEPTAVKGNCAGVVLQFSLDV